MAGLATQGLMPELTGGEQLGDIAWGKVGAMARPLSTFLEPQLRAGGAKGLPSSSLPPTLRQDSLCCCSHESESLCSIPVKMEVVGGPLHQGWRIRGLRVRNEGHLQGWGSCGLEMREQEEWETCGSGVWSTGSPKGLQVRSKDHQHWVRG